ncbi:hypothetical protein A0H81_12693 [Grifola frondosa]|uniref:Uncharacterized protein n=1 Tax=Grifola frondosa TaxID=5627 RepID=A0A1C7LS30_GRIFR|nr:hypothetical protein A0H81_12693 [Grifola frondosa]
MFRAVPSAFSWNQVFMHLTWPGDDAGNEPIVVKLVSKGRTRSIYCKKGGLMFATVPDWKVVVFRQYM